MSKLISQLPEDIKVVALQRQVNECDELRGAFTWDNTPEKHEIWKCVSEGIYTPFRQFHDYLKQEENNGWIKSNGLAGEMPNVDLWVCDKNGNVFLMPKGEYIPLNEYDYYMPIIKPEPPTPKN